MTSSNIWDLAVNVVGLLGISALSVPALYANRYGRLLHKLSKLNPKSIALGAKKSKLEQDFKNLRDSWTLTNSLLLIGGTALAALSYAIAIAKALIVQGP